MKDLIVGVLGAGQLGRMLALAGYPLGLRFRFLDSSSEAPARYLAEMRTGDYGDITLLDQFAEGLSVITYEFENVPVACAMHLARHVPVYPPPLALEVSQDRLVEKTFLKQCGIPTADFAAVNCLDELVKAIQRIGLPAVLKTRQMGYDGRGQTVIHSLSDVAEAWNKIGGSSLILEAYINFDRELSVLAVRSSAGDITQYPLVHNWHYQGILRRSVPLVAVESSKFIQLEHTAVSYINRILSKLDYVGVLTLELFEVNGQLLVNEMAPRVHNSGHWSIEGSVTSQFENHLRAILGLPLGSTRTIGYPAMINLIGAIPDKDRVLRIADAHMHEYGKTPRPGRKLGHITIQAQTAEERDLKIADVERLLGG